MKLNLWGWQKGHLPLAEGSEWAMVDIKYQVSQDHQRDSGDAAAGDVVVVDNN